MGEDRDPAGPGRPDIEVREIDAEVKSSVTVYDRQVIDFLEGDSEMEGEPQVIEYACGHALVQSDRNPIPAGCPECGGVLYG